MPRLFSIAVLTCLVAVALAAAAEAQTLRGRVVDPDARAVAGADVLVVHHDAIAATARTRADGRFGPLDLPPGRYDLIVAAPGLHAAPAHVTIEPGVASELDVPLAVSAVQESVVVSASQVDTPLSRATDAVTVIDRAELELKHVDTLADMLRLVPGFGVVASGGRGAITSIFPRGGESNYTLVLVDGIPQNSFGGGFDAAHLDTADVERVEIVRGPASAIYGSGAIGGVVHVVTRQGGPPRGSVSLEGGGYGFVRSVASATGSRRGWSWGGAVDRLASDGDTRFDNTLQRRIANDDYERVAGSGSVGWSNRPDRTVRVDVRGDRDIRGYPGPYGSDPAHQYGGLDLKARGHNTSREVAAAATFGRPAPGRHRVQLTWAGLKSQYAGQFGDSEDRTSRATARYQFDRDLWRAGVSAGFEFLHERVDNTYITGAAFQPVPVSRSVSGLFAEARPSMGPRGFLTIGARLERIQRAALESDPSLYNLRPAFNGEVVWSANPKVSAAWFLRAPGAGGWTKVRGAIGTGIKPPTGFEIAYTNNPHLKPERNRSVDAGIEQALAGSVIVADATWFFNRYDDLIASVGSSYAGPNAYRTDNIANASARGLETGVRWRGPGGIAMRGAWTFLHTEILGFDTAPTLAPAPFAIGNPLVRRPKQQGFAEITWANTRGTAFVTVGGRGRMTDYEPTSASSIFTNPGYASVSMGGALTLRRQLEIFVRVNNAFDRRYEEVLGFPALGRTASVGLRVAAGR